MPFFCGSRSGARRCPAGSGASSVKRVMAAWFLVSGGETVGNLRAIAVQDLADLSGRSQLQGGAQEIDPAPVVNFARDVQEDSAHGAVDGDEQVAARGLVVTLQEVVSAG